VNRDEKPKPKQFFYISSALLLALSISLVYASVFVYYPASVNFQGVRPPVVFQAVADVPATISPWGTYAQVYVSVSLAQTQLMQNPNFTGTLNPWIAMSNTSIGSWTAYSTTSSDGWVARYSTSSLTRSTPTTAQLYQDVYLSPGSYMFVIRHRYSADGGVFETLRYGIYDTNTNTWICSRTSIPYSWIETSFTCYITSAGNYRVMINLVVSTNAASGKSVDYQIDYIGLYGLSASFTGSVLEVSNNDSRPYYAVLILDPTLSNMSTVASCNITIDGSTRAIQIRNGYALSSTTSEVPINQWSSIPINVNATVTWGTSTLYLTLRYCTLSGGDGVCVYYPLAIALSTG